MMKRNLKKVLTGVAGAAVLVNAAAVQADSDFTAVAAQAREYTAVDNVQGNFTFDQSTLTPSDEVFNLFGTALTGVCAKPAFAFENSVVMEKHYINVGGSIKRTYSVDLNALAERGKAVDKTMVCSCATGPAVAMAQVTGVKLSDILSLAEMNENVNTVTAIGSDGYGLPLPLQYVLEKEAMLVYQINGEATPYGTQLWIPDTVAKYFTRNVVDLVLSEEAEETDVVGCNSDYRAKVNLLNYSDGVTFAIGDEITFDGYADDCGRAISAVEFSLDNGENWTSYATENALQSRWVHWSFAYQPESAGDYCLSVRARSEDGTVSPLTATLYFSVSPESV